MYAYLILLCGVDSGSAVSQRTFSS